MARERAERDPEASAPQPQAGLSIAEIRQLITLMSNSDIEEIAIEQQDTGLKLLLKKPGQVTAAASETDYIVEAEEHSPIDGDHPRDHSLEITASYVGIYHSSMKPGGKPLVAAGDIVREGQVVAAIEALNVYNEVETERGGRVRELLVGDGQPVEYGQTLLVIDPQ